MKKLFIEIDFPSVFSVISAVKNFSDFSPSLDGRGPRGG